MRGHLAINPLPIKSYWHFSGTWQRANLIQNLDLAWLGHLEYWINRVNRCGGVWWDHFKCEGQDFDSALAHFKSNINDWRDHGIADPGLANYWRIDCQSYFHPITFSFLEIQNNFSEIILEKIKTIAALNHSIFTHTDIV